MVEILKGLINESETAGACAITPHGALEMGETCELSEVEAMYYENKPFVEAAFEEEDIQMPSDAEIISAAKEYLMQYLDDA